MRNNIVSPGADELKYEIREIVAVAKEFGRLGIEVIWENIGDPVQKGEKIPGWIKDIVIEASREDMTYAYSPTKGLEATREFLAQLANTNGKVRITKEDIIFFNGLGDAISKIYGQLRREYRVIGPSPAYSTHSSAEAAHAGAEYISYNLDPRNLWYPDLSDLRMKVKYNPAISGIQIINPDNPTGAVYPKEVLQEIVAIAREYDLFIVCDEIYINMAYNGKRAVPLAEVIGDVCGISMKGISKELPWPGSRCGWIEVYNQKEDPVFAKYVKSILDDKMLEVCSTTLPQKVIPTIFGDKRFPGHVEQRNKRYERRSNVAYDLLKDIKGIVVNRTNGAFYMTVMFEESALNGRQSLPVKDKAVKDLVEKITDNVALDKRFVYYLLATTGICVVPLTGFNCSLKGFRITLLENDEARFEQIFRTVREKIIEYLKSA
ncbi:MAG TPA: pyridoxal phosphate-dependent aminotransferase [Nitrospirota bacterium]|nr:pyridoxal phosphate-dependent aminotransferase [Nitrospirota bacterium]